MFKKLKSDRNAILLVFFFESIIAIAAIILKIIFNKNETVEAYGIYALLAYFIFITVINVHLIRKLLKVSENYLIRTDVTIASIFGNEVSPIFQFGNLCIMVYNEDDEVIWLSQTSLLKKEEILGQPIYKLIPNFDSLSLKEDKQDVFTSISGKIFQVNINTGLKVIYLKDVTAENIQQKRMEEERPFIGHIVIDNYQDVITSLGEADFQAFVSKVKDVVNKWCAKYYLFVRPYGNDSFLVIGEESNYQKLLKDNFSVLEEVRKIHDNPLTISIGIGKGHTSSILRTSELAYSALNMALTRGGDQAVVSQFGKNYEYYGAKNEVKQTRSHVRGRVLASSLATLIKNSQSVIIMGHKISDFDALGASIGVYAICKSLKVPVHFVYNEFSIDLQLKKAFRNVYTQEEIAKMTYTPEKALQEVDNQTLVIVVDTHVPNMTLQPELLDKCKEVCVIDHHRKSDKYIENPIFEYHEPASSSASELVTELIYYQPSKVEITDKVANLLLSGISLDTKFFKSSASSKTFEMAMILKNYGATVEAVNGFFKEEYEEMILLNNITNNCESIGYGIYITTYDKENINRVVLSKVAESILETKETKAVFVIGTTGENQVSISARSTTDFNVQVIMESMGGGGHFSKAAAQFTHTTVNDVKAILIDKVNIYLRDGRVA